MTDWSHWLILGLLVAALLADAVRANRERRRYRRTLKMLKAIESNSAQLKDLDELVRIGSCPQCHVPIDSWQPKQPGMKRVDFCTRCGWNSDKVKEAMFRDAEEKGTAVHGREP